MPPPPICRLSQRPGEGVKTAGPRCYCRLLFCNSYGHTYTPNAWSAAQAVAASYQPPAAPAPAPTRGTAGRAADTEQRTVRRIVFHRRAAQTRQFLNLPELLERCSQWSLGAASAAEPGPGAPAPQLAGSSSQQGQPVGAAIAPASALEPSVGGGRHSSQPQVECSTHAFKDLADSIATAREASVFVGTHGANIANGEHHMGSVEEDLRIRVPGLHMYSRAGSSNALLVGSASYPISHITTPLLCRHVYAPRQRDSGGHAPRLGPYGESNSSRVKTKGRRIRTRHALVDQLADALKLCPAYPRSSTI